MLILPYILINEFENLKHTYLNIFVLDLFTKYLSNRFGTHPATFLPGYILLYLHRLCISFNTYFKARLYVGHIFQKYKELFLSLRYNCIE